MVGRYLGVAVLLLTALCVPVLQAADDFLAKAKRVYEKTMVGVLADYDEQMADWAGQCLAALEAERIRLQNAGDLDGWVVVDKAVKRFEAARDIAEADIEAAPAALRDLLMRSTLKRTEYVSLTAPVSVSAWEGSQRRGSRSNNDSAFSSFRSKTREDDRFLRLMLRTGRSGLVLTDLYVYAQYFANKVSSLSSSPVVGPVQKATRTVKLDRLTEQSQFIDLAPASFDTSASSYRSRFFSFNRKTGSRYYGAIISVFAADGTLLYQGASRPQLCELAKDRAPDFGSR